MELISRDATTFPLLQTLIAGRKWRRPAQSAPRHCCALKSLGYKNKNKHSSERRQAISHTHTLEFEKRLLARTHRRTMAFFIRRGTPRTDAPFFRVRTARFSSPRLSPHGICEGGFGCGPLTTEVTQGSGRVSNSNWCSIESARTSAPSVFKSTRVRS